jgi:hypothetical protein
MRIVSIGSSQRDVFFGLLVQDALFDEKHLSDIGSFDDVLHVQRLARLDDTGQVQ